MRMNTKKGFTLIELLIVIVIIGILAAIAIPKFAATKDKAKLASVKTDIRNYMTSEEAYFSDYAQYGTYTAMAAVGAANMSNGNVPSNETADANGYTVTITNASISSKPNQCKVSNGNVSAGTPYPQAGEIICS